MFAKSFEKSVDCKSRKVHFLLDLYSKVIRIRAVCLILRNDAGDCFMINESHFIFKSDATTPTIGFCGGTCELEDESPMETALREMYEECMLKDILPENWRQQWKEIYERLKTSPTTPDEHILRFVMVAISFIPSFFIHGNNELKALYLHIRLPDQYIQHLVKMHNIYRVRPNIFQMIVNMRNRSGIVYCSKFSFALDSAASQMVRIRRREIDISTSRFISFLTCGMSYSGTPTGISTFHDLVQPKMLTVRDSFINGVARAIKSELLDQATLFILITQHTQLDDAFKQLVQDYWYEHNQVEQGLEVIALTDSIKYKQPVSESLLGPHHLLLEIITLYNFRQAIWHCTPKKLIELEKNLPNQFAHETIKRLAIDQLTLAKVNLENLKKKRPLHRIPRIEISS